MHNKNRFNLGIEPWWNTHSSGGNPHQRLGTPAGKTCGSKEVERFDGEETCKGHDSACFGDTKPIKRVYGCDDTPFVSVLSHDWVITRWDDRFFACNSQDLAHYYGHLLLDNAFLLAEEQELPDLPVPLVQATFEGIVVVSVLGVDKSWYSKLQNMKSRTQHKLPRQDTAPLFWEASFTCSVCSHNNCAMGTINCGFCTMITPTCCLGV